MKSKIQKFISKNSLFNPYDKIIVAVSGGADSVALLHFLLSMNYDCVVAHCNFHLRGEESDRDEDFVAGLAKKFDCKFLKTDFDTKKYAGEQKISIEMAARELRYRWFEEIRTAENATSIVVAHHQDDAAETILMNLSRGTGINGLTGIKPKNGNIVRPFLCISRKEIMTYIKCQKLSFVTDSTNADTQITRNFFRKEIIPAFEKINPSFSENLLQTAGHLNDVAIIYNDYINNAKRDIVQNGEETKIDIKKLQKSKITGSLLFETIKDFGFNSSQSADILSVIDGESGKQFFSPTHRLVKDRDFLIISPIVPFSERSRTAVSECRAPNLHTEIFPRTSDFKIDKSPNIAFLDNNKITQPLTLRHWQAGDAFYPIGMQGKKKLSDFFTDKKYTLQKKEQVWLLISDDKIVWIVGERLDDRFKVTAETKNILKIWFEHK